MFKLKLINKPKMIKLKCGFSFPNIVLANLQEKEVIPTKEVQGIVADKTYDGLSRVTVQPIPNEYIVPSGEIEFTQNGTYDVTDKASAKVNIKEKVLGTKTITSNGTYKAIDDNLDGYSEVEVATSGVDINEYFNLTKRTSGNYTYYIKKLPLIDTSDYTSFYNMFANIRGLEEIPPINTGKGKDFDRFMYMCNKVKRVPQLDFGSATDVQGVWNTGNNQVILEYHGGYKDVGKAYSTTASANINGYRIIFGNYILLPHDSLMNVINNLYDIKTKGVKPQQVVLGSGNLAKLSEEELAIAQNKGWSVS